MRVDLPPDVIKQLDNVDQLSPEQKQKLLGVLTDLEQYKKYNKLFYYNPDPPFKQFFNKGKNVRMRGLIAGNRTGKTYGTTFEVACHATGLYPRKETHGWDWQGVEYSKATDGWVLGYTMESICSPANLRDLLIGTPGNWGTGWIPKDKIESISFVNESKGLIKEIRIKHTSGGISTVGIRNYSQGMAVLMGASLDYFLIDESPRDDSIFPQLTARVQKAQDKLGRGMVSATPEYGLQPLIGSFVNPDGQYHDGYVGCTVWDVSHINEDEIETMKNDYPEYQWDMRLKGLPIMGNGSVYPYKESDIWFEDVRIESHWKVVVGVDFGWTHPSAVVFVAYNPDTDDIYVFDAKKKSEWSLPEMAAFINKNGYYPVTWPADGGNETQGGGGVSMRDQLAGYGCQMLSERFHNPSSDGKKNNSVEAGLTRIRTLMKIGKLKIHRNLSDLWGEYRTYHYDPKTSKVVKTNDDLLDAMRYAIQSVEQYGESKMDQQSHDDEVDYQNYTEFD